MKKRKELRFYIILIISLAFMFGFRFLPAPNGLSASGMQVAGIFIGVLILWLFVAIDWPSILLLGALALVPELSFSSILASSYGNTTFVFLLFTFIITYALGKTSYLKRIALAFISSSIAKKGPWSFVTLYCASIIFLGMFISPTVLFFVYLPLLEEIFELLKLKKGDKLAALLMMSTVIMCGISSGMTPIAHVFPLISMGLYADMYGVTIDYARYMIAAIPVGLLTAVFVLIVFKVFLRPDMSALKNFDLRQNLASSNKASLKEKIVLIDFIFVILMWILPGLVMLLVKDGPVYACFAWFDSLGTAMPPLIGLVILCIVHIDQKPLLTLSEAMSKGVSWPSLIMCAGTLAIGSALTNSEIGFTSWLSLSLSPMISTLDPLVMVLIFSLWAALQTNLSSNMVTASRVTTAALSITSGMTNISIPAVVICVGMLSAYAFATPPAMPCVAIAGSSGWTNTLEMMKYGFAAMFIAVILTTLVAYPLAALLF